MRVEVVCFGALRGYLPDPARGRASIDLREGATVGDVIAELGAPARLAFSVLVDGERAELGRRLEESAEVTLMPPFTGGARVQGRGPHGRAD